MPPPETADLIYGNAAIARFLGMTTRQAKSRTSSGQIPAFRMGRRIVARRATLMAWVGQLEAGHATPVAPASGSSQG